MEFMLIMRGKPIILNKQKKKMQTHSSSGSRNTVLNKFILSTACFLLTLEKDSSLFCNRNNKIKTFVANTFAILQMCE